MARILLTGGAGYVGSHCAKALAAAGQAQRCSGHRRADMRVDCNAHKQHLRCIDDFSHGSALSDLV